MEPPGTESAGIRHPLAAVAASSVMAVVVWFGLCWRFLVRPRVDPMRPVDAVQVLDPVAPKLATARAAMAASGAKVMVISVPKGTRDAAGAYCDTLSYEVICRTPDPSTTRGEAIALGQLARERGWQRVGVVTYTSHVSRTRMLMQRCVPADAVVWEVADPSSLRRWARRFVYETGAWLKAQVVRGC